MIQQSLMDIYESLRTMYGRQLWWPAESPFEVMVGALLTQNTNWSNVEKAFIHLKKQSNLSANAILRLPTSVLESCLKPSGYFRIKTRRLQNYCRWYLKQGGYNGLDQRSTSTLREELLSVQGIGTETADDILLYAFNRPVFVIDAYTRRLLQRLNRIQGHENYEYCQKIFETQLPKRVDLYKQYHALIVVHAKQHCRKTKPVCLQCLLQSRCHLSDCVK
ncbi:base excision repair protein, HhH-GPD family [Rickettsiella grylli]|uniref:Base excision repair protein, HhH-GPD family n=1 Tax=Rickettsiella grylli TaxID=59196 RepID=A8PLQ7_9COXI|nr:base excision repair protein, HhH-GPD family [Rickettsiella grylli]